MFSRIVTMKLKPSHIADLTKILDEKVLPLLRKQEGFKDVVVLANNGGAEAISISLWDTKANAESYSQKAYPQVLTSLTDLLDGSPQVKSLEVISTTLRQVAAIA
jgi:heme-degrading monooxygenase HmoA